MRNGAIPYGSSRSPEPSGSDVEDVLQETMMAAWRGQDTLAGLPGGRTRVTFEYAWQKAPMSEALAAPLVRAVSRRASQRAMERLAEQLRTREADSA